MPIRDVIVDHARKDVAIHSNPSQCTDVAKQNMVGVELVDQHVVELLQDLI